MVWPRERYRRHGVLLTGLLALLIVGLAVPFGGVLRGALLAAQLIAFATAAWALLAARRLAHLRPVAWPAAALLALALFGFLQTLPLPGTVVELLSPRHAELYAEAGHVEVGLPPVTGTAEETSTDGRPWPRLSVSPQASRTTALHILALAAALLAAGWAGRHGGHRRLLVLALAASALFQVFYGARAWLVRSDHILGVEVLGDGSRLRGTFVNSDHLALYLEIALPVLLAVTFWGWRQWHRQENLERRVAQVAIPALVWVVLFVGLAFSGSRAGLLAAAAGFAVQISLFVVGWGRRRGVKGLVLGAVIGLAGILAVLATGAREGFGRLLGTSTYEVTWNARLDTYRATWELWQQFPLTGTGLGTFREVFPLIQPRSLPGWWWHAHSDGLELLLTGGLVGVLLLGVGIAALVLRLLRVLRLGRRSEERAAAVAALGALTSVLLHELVDFGLTMPANAFTLVILCAAAAGVRLPGDDGEASLDVGHEAAASPAASRRRPVAPPPADELLPPLAVRTEPAAPAVPYEL